MIKFLVLNLMLVSASFARGWMPEKHWGEFQVIDSGAVIKVITWRSVRSHVGGHGYKTKAFEKYVEIDGLSLEGDEVVYNGVVCGKLGVTRVLKRPAILTTGNCQIFLDGDVPSIELR